MFVRGRVGFRPVDLTDLETLRALYNDASTFLQRGTVEMVSSEEQLSWWKGLANNTRTKRFTLVEMAQGQILGLVRVQNIERSNRNCEIGLDIIPALRSQGFGKAGYRALLDFLFLHDNMHLVYLKVADFNERARRLYESLGFTNTGYFKEYLYRHGRYWDYAVMCMTLDEFLVRRSAAAEHCA